MYQDRISIKLHDIDWVGALLSTFREGGAITRVRNSYHIQINNQQQQPPFFIAQLHSYYPPILSPLNPVLSAVRRNKQYNIRINYPNLYLIATPELTLKHPPNTTPSPSLLLQLMTFTTTPTRKKQVAKTTPYHAPVHCLHVDAQLALLWVNRYVCRL
ncbi:hypothetical protein M3J09_006989 [Ascochyta lentis]